MPKIHEGREPTYAPDIPERESEGTGVPSEGVEVPGDGSFSPEISGDGSGDALPLAEASATAPADYSALTVDQLRGLLAERDLSRSGTKAELVARLQEADAATTGTTGVTITAEATVTRPDGSVA